MKRLAQSKLGTLGIDHGLFHEFVSNASSMAWNHFIMKRLAHCKLGTEEIDHDHVKHGPT